VPLARRFGPSIPINGIAPYFIYFVLHHQFKVAELQPSWPPVFRRCWTRWWALCAGGASISWPDSCCLPSAWRLGWSHSEAIRACI
jgi:hypothetical protein